MSSLEFLDMSPVKREKLIKKRKLEKKVQMRNALPVLTSEEIRRYRLPYHEAMIGELEINHFPSTAGYIRQLIDYQNEKREQEGPETILWLKPQLQNSKHVLNYVRDALTRAEIAHNQDNISKEIDELLEIGHKFAFGDSDWHWLGHQILINCVNVASQYSKDGGYREALSRYVYGKYLIEIVNHYSQETYENLDVVRNISQGMSWSAKRIFGPSQRTLFIESCILLYHIIMYDARIKMKTDLQKAISLCVLARRRALDSCYHVGETEAFILKGECEIMCFNTAEAISTFQRALNIQLKHESPKELCRARIFLAVAYLKHGWMSSALNQLNKLKEYAEKNEYLIYVAQAFKYLGEYYLREGTPSNATPLLISAIKLFYAEKVFDQMEMARNLAAISVGLELLPQYLKLIIDCGEKDKKQLSNASMKKLLNWKDSREVFWIDSNVSIPSSGTYEEVLESTTKQTLGHLPDRECLIGMVSFSSLKRSSQEEVKGSVAGTGSAKTDVIVESDDADQEPLFDEEKSITEPELDAFSLTSGLYSMFSEKL